MKLKTLPAEVAAQLLIHLAENRALAGLLDGLAHSISLAEAKRVLFEIAGLLREAAVQNRDPISTLSLKSDPLLSDKTKELLSCLSPTEEKKLLSGFGLLES